MVALRSIRNSDGCIATSTASTPTTSTTAPAMPRRILSGLLIGPPGAPTRAEPPIGAIFQRPYATNAARSPTTNGIRAVTTDPIIRLITVAPIMTMTSPAAASVVSPGRIRSNEGRIRPSAPRISTAPMNCKKAPGIWISFVISSIGMMNFTTPANRNSSARSPWTIHNAYVMFRLLQ